MKFIIFKLKNLKKVKFYGFTVILEFKNSKITFGKDIVINSSSLSNLVGLYQRTILVSRFGGKIFIGNNCGISGSTIYSMSQIIIGDNCLIGANCKIIDNDFHPLELENRYNKNPKFIKKKDIQIGNDCFIGMNSIILKGSTIGDNCIIGAGSVVSGIFLKNSIIAGNPAKTIRTFK